MSFPTLAIIISLLSALFILLSVRHSGPKKASGTISGLFWTTCAVTFAAGMVSHPAEVFAGATMGLKTWWNIVFPSLLPFFIVSELLMNFGLVSFIGALMEPLMRPLFNVPGCGSFVMCIGYTSGYPIGAMVTARLRSQNLCTRIEAERLISFTNNSSPLFMMVAVSVGMFGRPELAVVIAGSHYLSNLTLGFLMRFYGRHDSETLPVRGYPFGSVFRRALSELEAAWEKENRPLGRIINDSVKNSVNSLLVIGGFIILFAVIIKLITVAGFIDRAAAGLGALLCPLGFSPEIMPALASGFFEMTIGSKMVSETTAPLIQQVAAIEMLLAWSGLSVIAQVAGMISETDIRMLPFVLARLAHAVLAALYAVFLFGPAIPRAEGLMVPATAALEKMGGSPSILGGLAVSGVLLLLAITSLIIISSLYLALRKVRLYL